MFDNVMETTGGPEVIDGSDFNPTEEEDTPIKPPAKRQLGPGPKAAKRKIESSESEATPQKKKVNTNSMDKF
jgi:hypothetical protein